MPETADPIRPGRPVTNPTTVFHAPTIQSLTEVAAFFIHCHTASTAVRNQSTFWYARTRAAPIATTAAMIHATGPRPTTHAAAIAIPDAVAITADVTQPAPIVMREPTAIAAPAMERASIATQVAAVD